MKRRVYSSQSESVVSEKGSELVRQIEKLFNKEEIPYDYVDCISEEDEDEIFIVAETYGDWRNDNDRAHELVVENLKPDRDVWEETDDDLSDYGLSAGSDSCIVRHEFIWNK